MAGMERVTIGEGSGDRHIPKVLRCWKLARSERGDGGHHWYGHLNMHFSRKRGRE